MAAITELEELINKANPNILGRNQSWFKTWSQSGKQQDYTPAIKLIKEFEGCHLTAYADPLHGWDVATIGWGTTRYPDGRKVSQGDILTAGEADRLLQQEIDTIAKTPRYHHPALERDANYATISPYQLRLQLGQRFLRQHRLRDNQRPPPQ
jgi:GH24 family phage-related lysozyme (muramidase)